jgi:hypothetical protein
MTARSDRKCNFNQAGRLAQKLTENPHFMLHVWRCTRKFSLYIDSNPNAFKYGLMRG